MKDVTGKASLLLCARAGLGYLGFLVPQAWWRQLAVASAAIGLLVLIISWDGLMPNPMWYIMGPVLNAGVLLVLLFIK